MNAPLAPKRVALVYAGEPRTQTPAAAKRVRSLGPWALLAGLVYGVPTAHAACDVDTPEISIIACEASFLREVLKRYGDVGIVLTPAEEFMLMAIQRDQWAERKATTNKEPAGDDRRPAGVKAPLPKHNASGKNTTGEARSISSTKDPK